MRLAFIGGWGHHYLRGAITDPACGIDSPVAVASDGRDPAAARAFANSLIANQKATVTWFDDPLAMLDQFRPEALSVGTVYALNGDFAAEALQQNIPVVSDKPVAASWEQFQRLERLTAGAPHRVLATEFDFRCRPDFVAAKSAVEAGLIGRPILSVAQKSYRFGTRPAWYGQRVTYGGTLMWIGSHAIDVIPYVTGRQYRRVSGVQGNLSHPELPEFEDHVVATFAMDDGSSAVIHADFLRPAAAATHGDDRLRIVGSAGVIEVRDGRCRLTTSTEAERDITDQRGTPPRPLHAELLAALRGESQLFGARPSLEIAKILLHVRSAVDESVIAPLPSAEPGRV